MIRVTRVPVWFDAASREPDDLIALGTSTCAADLAPDWASPDDPECRCTRNGVLVEGEDWYRRLADGDHLVFTRIPGEVFTGGTIGATAISGATAKVSIGAALFKFVAINASLLVLQRLLQPSRKPLEARDESATYAFSSLQTNERSEGAAIPVVYGEHRIAPPVINQSVRNFLDGDGRPRSELQMLLLIGEGPVQEICGKTADGGPFSLALGNFVTGLQIENQPAENFSEVAVHVRMGSLDQTPIPGFSEPTLTSSVAFVLLESDTNTPPTNVEATPGVFDPADPQITKWDKHGSFTMGDDADEFTVGILFPSGLFATSSSGNPVPNTVQFQTRYRRVDSGGVPFGDYVVLPPEPLAQANHQGPFRVEYPHRIISPDDFVPPVPGHKLLLPTGHGGATYTIKPDDIPENGPDDLEFTFVGWVRTAEGAVDTHTIFDWLDSNLGVSLHCDTNSFGTFRFRAGDGTVTTEFNVGSAAIIFTNINQFHHVAFTYKANHFPNGADRTRIYVNGTLSLEGAPMANAVLNLATAIRIGHSDTAGINEWVGQFDDMAFYTRELSAFEVAEKWGGGPPNDIAPGDENEQGLIVGFRFDTETVALGLRYSPEVFGPGTDDTAVGVFLGADPAGASDPTISTGADTGPVSAPATGTEITDRLLIEVHRLTADGGTVNPGEFGSFADSTWETVQTRKFLTFEFPGMALLAVFMPAQDQLNTSSPLVTALIKGRLVPVWDGVDPAFPSFTRQWNQNPWWIMLDAALNSVFGGGAYFTAQKLVLPQIKAAADHSDALVKDGGDTLPMLRADKEDSTSAGATDWPNGYIEFGVDATNPLPKNFPKPTAGVVSTGVFVNVTGTGSSPAEPTWFTDHKNGVPTEIREVVFQVGAVPPLMLFRAPQQTGVDTNETPYAPAGGNLVVQIFEKRHEFDAVFDRRDLPLWDALIQMAQTARGVPLLQGARLGAFYDRARSPVGYVNMASLRNFAVSFSGQRNRPNVEEIEFFDRLRSFERSNETIEHSEFTDPTKADARRTRRIRIEGITRRSQIRRHATHDLNAFFLLRRSMRGETDIETLSFLAGDVIEVSHDVAPYGQSGRVWEDSTATDEIKLDVEIVIEAGKTYEIICENAASNLRETVAVDTTASPPGTYAAGTTINLQGSGFTFTPDKDDKWGFGETGTGLVGASKQFVITKIGFNPATLTRDVEMIEYDAQVYDDDFGVLPAIADAPLPPGSDTDIPAGVEAPKLVEQTYTDPDGSIRTSLEVSFRHIADTRHAVAGTRVYVMDNAISAGFAGARLVADLNPDTTYCRIEGQRFRTGITYTVIIEPYNRFSAGRYRSVGTFLEFEPVGISRQLAAPANLAARVSGKRLFLSWDGSDHELARSVECRMGGWILGTRLGSAPGGAGQLIVESFASGPTNAEGVQAPTLFVRSRNQAGQYGDASSIVFDAEVVDADEILYEINEEDTWSGTREDLQIVAAPSQKLPLPIGDRGEKLSFSGASLTGAYEVTISTLAAAQDVFAQVIVEAVQIHPQTWDDFGDATWDDLDIQRWTWEGPTWTKSTETSNVTLDLQLDHGAGNTPPGTLRRFIPGPYYLKSAKVRVNVTRPSTDYDVEITRVAIRMTKIPPVPVNPIEVEVFR